MAADTGAYTGASSPRLPSERRFGLTFAFVLWAFAGYGAFKGAVWTEIVLFLVVGTFFLGLALAAPVVLRPLNRAWFVLGRIMGKVVSPLVLGAVFLAVIVPVGVTMRLFRRDALHLRQGASGSYWIDRCPPGPEGSTFRNQF